MKQPAAANRASVATVDARTLDGEPVHAALPSLPSLRLPVLVLLGVALRLGVLWLGVDALSERVEWSVGRSRLKQRQPSAHSVRSSIHPSIHPARQCQQQQPWPLPITHRALSLTLSLSLLALRSEGVLVLVERCGLLWLPPPTCSCRPCCRPPLRCPLNARLCCCCCRCLSPPLPLCCLSPLPSVGWLAARCTWSAMCWRPFS